MLKKPNPMSSIRLIAINALIKILTRPAKPKDVFDDIFDELEVRDRAFVMELVYGVLRHAIYIDWLLEPFIKTPAKVAPFTRNNLRAAIYQLVFMRVPDWAAVNEAVEAEKTNSQKASFVNAVLRSFLRSTAQERPLPEKDPVKSISIKTSHPEWLIKRWIERFGADEAAALAEANNHVPPIVLRVVDAANKERVLKLLEEKDIKAQQAKYSPDGIALNTCPPDIYSELLSTGAFIQDEASQLVAHLLNPLPGERVLDACAAPGGKVTHIAELMKDNGEVIAIESDSRRIPQLKENIKRLFLKSVKIVNADASAPDKNIGGDFDRILLDAPCSSLGVIRRNPDVKYRHSVKSLAAFHEKQHALLRSVSAMLRKGGTLVYSVCSTEPEEGEKVIERFLHNHPDFSIIKADQPFFNALETGSAHYRTYPHRHGLDGFFAARLKRN
ncbi:MAG: 16S rRNA (cytosine(967)-C(5))-methyltransferase RsmB [Nitrospirae bacterium]|nr:MAG: 16S rRNA (cytosine(967)-C(5))-methyltransferase RsmB [Nitrospirota bacterium]